MNIVKEKEYIEQFCKEYLDAKDIQYIYKYFD